MMRQKKFVRIVCVILAAIMALSVLFGVVSYLVPTAGAVSQKQIDELRAQAKELDKKKQAVQSEINSLRYEQSTALAKKEVLDLRIDYTEQEIQNINDTILAYDVLILEQEYEVQKAQLREDNQWTLYKRRIRDMEENGAISYLAVIFNAYSFSDLLARIDFVNDIMKADEATYNQLLEIKQSTIAAKEELEAVQAQQRLEVITLGLKQEELQGQLDEAGALIAELEANIETRNELFAQVDSDRSAIQNEINKKVEELRKQQDALEAAGKNGSKVVGSGQFIWPSAASRTVTSPFGSRFHPIYKRYMTHSGVDIGASQGTNIMAADGGTVITSAYSSSYGNYVVINHGNGKTTLYGHMSKRLCKEGEAVSKGSVIGLVGSTGNSTGPHLHFEISVNGSRVNPLNYFSDYTARY